MKRSVPGFRSVVPGISSALASVLLFPLRIYRRLISPALPARCKYYPSCSAYAEQAVRELGLARGLILAAWRLARCNPWSHGGVDELGDRSLFRHRRLRSHRRDPASCAPDHGAPA